MTDIELVATWVAKDKGFKQVVPGYSAGKSELTSRLENIKLDSVMEAMRVKQPTAWLERATERKGLTWQVGVYDNRDAKVYNATLLDLVAVCKELGGIKVRLETRARCNSLYITITGVEERAAALLPAYQEGMSAS